MIFKPLSLNGAFEVLLEPRGDARGFFSRFYCDEEFASHGLNTHWAQMNLSFSCGAGPCGACIFSVVPPPRSSWCAAFVGGFMMS